MSKTRCKPTGSSDDQETSDHQHLRSVPGPAEGRYPPPPPHFPTPPPSQVPPPPARKNFPSQKNFSEASFGPRKNFPTPPPQPENFLRPVLEKRKSPYPPPPPSRFSILRAGRRGGKIFLPLLLYAKKMGQILPFLRKRKSPYPPPPPPPSRFSILGGPKMVQMGEKIFCHFLRKRSAEKVPLPPPPIKVCIPPPPPPRSLSPRAGRRGAPKNFPPSSSLRKTAPNGPNGPNGNGANGRKNFYASFGKT